MLIMLKPDVIIFIVTRREWRVQTKVGVQNGNVDLALKKFKAKVARSGVPSEIKKRKHYEKPGVRRRNEIKEGIKNSHKRNRG